MRSPPVVRALARVTLVDAGGLGEAARGEPRVGKCAVQPQPVADVYTDIQRARAASRGDPRARLSVFGRGHGVVPVQFSVTDSLMRPCLGGLPVPSINCDFASASGLGG